MFGKRKLVIKLDGENSTVKCMSNGITGAEMAATSAILLAGVCREIRKEDRKAFLKDFMESVEKAVTMEEESCLPSA